MRKSVHFNTMDVKSDELLTRLGFVQYGKAYWQWAKDEMKASSNGKSVNINCDRTEYNDLVTFIKANMMDIVEDDAWLKMEFDDNARVHNSCVWLGESYAGNKIMFGSIVEPE